MTDKTIMRVKKDKNNPYIMLNKEFVNDTGLSFKAKGILLYLLSKPDNWRIMICDLINSSIDGETAVRNGIKELITAGYIEKKITRTNKGRFEKFEYIIYETRQTFENSDVEPIVENQEMDPPIRENPYVENQHMDNQHADNHVLLNNELINNDLLSNELNNNNQFGENQKNVVVVDELKEKIDKKIGSISLKGISYLLNKSNPDTINYYLDNWSKFKGVGMKSKQGFFIAAVVNKYSFPDKQQGETYKPAQALNYEQREYDDEFYDSLYCNLEYIK